MKPPLFYKEKLSFQIPVAFTEVVILITSVSFASDSQEAVLSSYTVFLKELHPPPPLRTRLPLSASDPGSDTFPHERHTWSLRQPCTGT